MRKMRLIELRINHLKVKACRAKNYQDTKNAVDEATKREKQFSDLKAENFLLLKNEFSGISPQEIN